jgi:hypothetical protein
MHGCHYWSFAQRRSLASFLFQNTAAARCSELAESARPMVSDHVEFTTTYFVAVPGEDRDTNPGVVGLPLAEWVAQSLKARGVPVELVVAEDFGRCVIIKRKPVMLFIACASTGERAARWRMFIGVEQNWLTRLFGGGNANFELARLRDHFRAIVTLIPGVLEVVWQHG